MNPLLNMTPDLCNYWLKHGLATKAEAEEAVAAYNNAKVSTQAQLVKITKFEFPFYRIVITNLG